jgi:hypothetical protein
MRLIDWFGSKVPVPDDTSTEEPRSFKRLLVISDTHCGHEVGLTPPHWNPKGVADRAAMEKYRNWMWDGFVSMVEPLKPIDILVHNGDAIDGRGDRIGGVEGIFADRNQQCRMAADVIKWVGAPKVLIARGTDYHVGREENFEDTIAGLVNADRIGDIVTADVNGVSFQFRHHIGGSQVPHGRGTALLREQLWNELWHVENGFPMANVIVRSHVHYHQAVQSFDRLALTTPGLQGYGTRYGERRLSGIIHFGIVYFDVYNKEDFTWRAKRLAFPRVEPMVL